MTVQKSTTTIQFGIVVGIDNKIYRVVVANAIKKGENQYDWKFDCKMLDEKQVINSIKSGSKWLNIKLENNKLKGSAGALSRFEDAKHKPIVIISQLVNSESKTLGFKVASYDGSVKNIPIKEMLAYGNRITKAGSVPEQKAIFVSADGDKKEHYKSYPNCSFITEVILSNKNKNTEHKKVALQKNEKTLSRLEEIYTKEQLRELQTGKKSGVDIRIYANPALSAEQMHVLMNGLKNKLNVKPIAHPEYDVMCMKYYIDCLQNNIDIRQFTSSKYDIGQISELSLAVELGLDISKMSNPKLSAEDMAEIRERLEKQIWKEELVKKDGTWK